MVVVVGDGRCAAVDVVAELLVVDVGGGAVAVLLVVACDEDVVVLVDEDVDVLIVDGVVDVVVLGGSPGASLKTVPEPDVPPLDAVP